MFQGSTALQAPPEPPTALALKLRPWLTLVFLLLLPVAGARCATLDVGGGFIAVLIAASGWYALRDGGADAGRLLCLCVILLVNSVIDTFILLAHTAHSHWHFFAAGLPYRVNVLRGLLILGPVLELAGACLCWLAYRERMAELPDDLLLHLDQAEGMGPDQGYGAAPLEGLGVSRSEPKRTVFKAFCGVARRLSG